MQRIGTILGVLLLILAVTVMTLWGMGALYYADAINGSLRRILAAAFGLATLGAFVFLPYRRRTLLGYLAVWVALVVWWNTLTPSHDRDWQPNVAVLPYATVDGDRVTLHNIRNFAYRTDTDFTPQYYDKTFDLTQLESVDLVSSYWGSQAIAHLFVSFGFGGQNYVAVSIETRMQHTERYSTLAGFFKQYELIYIVVDERDVIRLRTTYRQQPPEDVYLYRVRMPPARARRFFMSYVEKINALKAHPEFYNTLLTNCTTNILFHAETSGSSARYNWKVLLSGYAPEYVYEIGNLDTSLPFAALRQRSHINARAQAASDASNFSQRIRVGLPLPPPAGG